nr:hypothetical protein Iba_chr06bCG13730 [Ipomoea batatas]
MGSFPDDELVNGNGSLLFQWYGAAAWFGGVPIPVRIVFFSGGGALRQQQ